MPVLETVGANSVMYVTQTQLEMRQRRILPTSCFRKETVKGDENSVLRERKLRDLSFYCVPRTDLVTRSILTKEETHTAKTSSIQVNLHPSRHHFLFHTADITTLSTVSDVQLPIEQVCHYPVPLPAPLAFLPAGPSQ